MTAVPEIDVVTLSERLMGSDPPALLDVREPWEIDLCWIDGSQCVPLADLPNEIKSLPADRPLVVVCHHGVRSRHAAMWLRAQGFDNAVNLAGGIDAWARQVDPAMRVY